MKPNRFSPAHTDSNFCELVCSNSLKSTDIYTSSGLLKRELEILDSLVIAKAKENAVGAGGALAVDRKKFAEAVTEVIKNHPNIEIVNSVADTVKGFDYVIVATGPLTEGRIANELAEIAGSENLYFFDAASPIVTYESIDMTKAFWGSRYGKGGDDYINCPMTKEQYDIFYKELVNAQSAKLHGFEGKEVFEGCMPVEVMAKRGYDAIRFGPLKPMGFTDENGKRPYALVQLRAENPEKTLFNLVGFQTNLKFGEQKRVFSLIPGLEQAEFVRYGVMHRNTFINAPKTLSGAFMLMGHDNIMVAGQLSGVEGYCESIMSGLICGINMYRIISGKEPIVPPPFTMSGAIINYLNTPNQNFQPMNANLGILPPIEPYIKDKQARRQKLCERAIEALKEYADRVDS